MSRYVPSLLKWDHADPESAGFFAGALQDAVAFARCSECDWPASLFFPDGRYVGTDLVNDLPPHDKPIGIVRPRGATSGLILRKGHIVAEWGDILRADTTFSAAKGYLALLAGVALDDGLIRSLDDRISNYAQLTSDGGFEDHHNVSITWRHLLQQTSEWQGTLWGMPDSIDHHRDAGPHVAKAANRRRGTPRALGTPGTRWEYNDVRVNRLALLLTRLFRRPLDEMLRERIMNPIGASENWEWHGYDNAGVVVDGRLIVAVSGGSHWGAGLFVSTRDHARVGLLVARKGDWGGRRLLSSSFLAELATPTALNPQYGFLWWLNTGRQLFPSIGEDALLALGGGQHMVWISPSQDLVVVARWIEKKLCDALLGRIASSLRHSASHA